MLFLPSDTSLFLKYDALKVLPRFVVPRAFAQLKVGFIVPGVLRYFVYHLRLSKFVEHRHLYFLRGPTANLLPVNLAAITVFHSLPQPVKR